MQTGVRKFDVKRLTGPKIVVVFLILRTLLVSCKSLFWLDKTNMGLHMQ